MNITSNKLLIATKNPGKYHEITTGLKDFPFGFIFLGDLSLVDDFKEEGTSYQDIALKKAKYFYAKTGLPTLADDSGIEVESLKGEMGIYTRRWGAGEKAGDEEWLAYFLNKMEKFPAPENRRAKFISCIALVGLGEETVVQGEVSGVITGEPEAPLKKGIPLSSCFKPDGCRFVYSALSNEEKGKISHRGLALQKIKPLLKAKIKV